MLGSRILGNVAGTIATIPRLDGPWPRWKLFHGSAPKPLDTSTYLAQNRRPLERTIPAAASHVNYAYSRVGPMGPPPAPGLSRAATLFPGPSLLEPAGFVPPAPVAPTPWTGPPEFAPAGNVVFPVGVPGPAPVLTFGSPFFPALAPPYAGPSPSFWDL